MKKSHPRESMEPKSSIPISRRQKEERRKSTAENPIRRPSPAVGRKDRHPPKKRIDYFGYINEFLKENGKEPPFPKGLKSYDTVSYAKAATSILSLIDGGIKEINRNSLEREFCDILDIIGYPYNVRDCVHSIPTSRNNYQFALDPLRWLASLISTYNQYISIPEEEKLYDEQTKRWLKILNVFIEAYGLWFEGRDEEFQILAKTAFTTELEEEERKNQELQSQYQDLQQQIEYINKAFDTSIEGNIQSLKMELEAKKSEFEETDKERTRMNHLIENLESQIQEYNQMLNECTQKENDLIKQAENMPCSFDEIEKLLQKPDIIKQEIDRELSEIEGMKKQINDNEIKFKDQCEALTLIAGDINDMTSKMNIGNSIRINNDGEATGELFGTDLDEVVQSILSKKPNIPQIERENAKLIEEKNKIDEELALLKKEEEELLSVINSNKDSNGKNVGKVNKKLDDIQKENQKLSREIQSNDNSVKMLFSKLDDKYKSFSNHVSKRFAEYMEELNKVQEAI